MQVAAAEVCPKRVDRFRGRTWLAGLIGPAMMSLALLAAPAAVNAAPTVSLTKTPPASGSVPSGQDFNYNFAWSCPGTVTPRD